MGIRISIALGLPASILVATIAPRIIKAQSGDEYTNRRVFQVTPTFEENAGGIPDNFVWRTSGVIVGLSVGGEIAVRTQAGEAHLRFAGANAESKPRGEGALSGKTAYYLGTRENWRTAAHYDRVRYSSIYPGIDVVFLSKGNSLEYNFEVAPYADPKRIRIAYEGSTIRVARGGELELGDAINQDRPVAVQIVQGRKRRVPCEYRLTGNHEASLRLGSYDRTRALVIDPVLNFSTYLGGSSYDAINGVAADAQGNLYATGETSSGSLTTPSSPPRSSRDVFIAKFNSSGTQVSVVYLGGSSYDSGRAIALDSSGNIYVTGVTESSNFPVTSGVLMSQAPGTQQAFAAKFGSNLALQYSTYLGGGNNDAGMGIAVDSSGDAYVAGQTGSSSFPVTQGAFQTSLHGGTSDCFVSKLNPTGSALLYSTFLGGSGLDLCSSIALDSSGDAYVTGTTYSSDFPLAGAIQSNLGGTATAFVTKLNASGSALVYSSYLGGSVMDNGNAIAVDSSGAAYLAGYTSSVDFPTTAGAFQTSLGGRSNAFVSKISAAGSALIYSTLVGGSGSDAATSIAADSLGRAIIGGYTTSSNYPVSGAIQANFQGAFDAFATVLDPAGATLVFSSYFGGSGDDRGYAVATALGNTLYLAGITSSSNFPVENAIQSGLQVAPDGFALSVAYAGGQPAVVSVTPNSGSGMSQTFTLEYSDTAGAASLQQVWTYFNATLANPASNACMLYYNVAANQINLLNDNVTAWMPATPGAAVTLQNSQCALNVANTSVTMNGKTLTLNLAMTFKTAYAGSKNIYMFANDVSGSSSGWQNLGSWTVPTATVSVVSVTPSSGTGMSHTFALQYSDTAGTGDLQQMWLYINATLANPAVNACMLYYIPASNQINFLSDNGAVWQSATLGSATTLQNSQCASNLAGASVTLNGNVLTLNLPLSFKPAYAGTKNIYMVASDISGANSGWQQRGTWTVASPAGTPSVVSSTPSSGADATQTFALQYSDTAGASSLQQVWAYFNATLANPASNACMLYYDATAHLINLLADNGSTWQPGTPGAATILQNSQCSVNLASTSVALSANTFILNVAMTFKPAYAGSKNIYAVASDISGLNSGWQQIGSWTVPSSAGVPAVVSITPSSGAGLNQTFTLEYSDSAGGQNLQQVWVYFNATLANPATDACMLYFSSSANLINLLADNGAVWMSAAPGAALTLRNSQCSLNVATSSVVVSGSTVTLNLPLTFTPAYAGPKNVYMVAGDIYGVTSGWQQQGTWTVP